MQEMKFLRNMEAYTRLFRIANEYIRKIKYLLFKQENNPMLGKQTRKNEQKKR